MQRIIPWGQLILWGARPRKLYGDNCGIIVIMLFMTLLVYFASITLHFLKFMSELQRGAIIVPRVSINPNKGVQAKFNSTKTASPVIFQSTGQSAT